MTVSLLHSRLTAFIVCSVKHESKWKCSDISPKQKRRKRQSPYQWIKEESLEQQSAVIQRHALSQTA